MDGPVKIKDKYYGVGEGIFGCSITEYVENNSDDDHIKLERVSSENIKVFKSKIEAYAFLVDLWRENENTL